MIFFPPLRAWNAAWRLRFAKIFVPKNFPNKPCTSKVPTQQRESRNLPWFLLPRVALQTLRGAYALQKFSHRKISRTNLAEPKFRQTSANPVTSHDFCSPAACLKRCVAPTLCKNFRAEKFPEQTLHKQSSDATARIQELTMIFASPRCPSNAAWRLCVAKIFTPKNFANKPGRAKVPTNQRESRNIPWFLLPRGAAWRPCYAVTFARGAFWMSRHQIVNSLWKIALW